MPPLSDTKLRGVHRTQVTKLIKKINDVRVSTGSVDADDFAVQVKTLKSEQEHVKRYDERILTNLNEEDLESEYAEIMRRDQLTDTCLVKAERFFKNLSLQISATGQQTSASHQTSIKLPQVTLLFFDGNPLDWPSFWDCFEATIHARSDFSGSQKFTYLIGQLKGTASNLLSGFTLTNQNYIEAVDLLKETYGKPDKIIIAHLHALMDLKSPNNNSVELEEFRSRYECHLRALNQLRPTIKDAGFLIATILMRKLPSKVKENMSRASKISLWELVDFKKYLADEIEFCRENGDKRSKPDQKTKCSEEVDTKFRAAVGNYNANVSFAQNKINQKFNRVKTCRFCSGKHSSHSCVQYQSYEARSKRVAELKLCANCLYDHGAEPCRSKYHCYFCYKRHPSSICPNPKKESDMEVVVNAQLANELTVMTTGSVQPKKLMSSAGRIAQPTMLLTIQTHKGNYYLRAMFDQCAQWSLELLGIQDQHVTDQQILEDYQSTLDYEESGYIARWPWKDKSAEILSNFGGTFGIFNFSLQNFKKVLGRTSGISKKLEIILYKIYSVFNNRSLTYESGKLDELPSLTPNQLIFGHRLDAPFPLPTLEIDEDYEVGPEVLNKRQKRTATLIQNFWKRWQADYLTGLKECKASQTGSIKMKVGDVVLIHNETPRIFWRMGRIKELVVGKDDMVRSAVLQTNFGMTTRPAAKLYPLEVSSNFNLSETSTDASIEENILDRPTRNAALKANQLIKAQLKSNDEDY